jgi:hypothetical protein
MKEQNQKYRYELILGVISLIIALSAYKEELKTIKLDLGFWKTNLSTYLLYNVYGFAICIYLYIIERISRQFSLISTWRIINYIEKLAFSLFTLIILSPIALSLVYGIYSIVEMINQINEEEHPIIMKSVVAIISSISGVISVYSTKVFFKKLKREKQELIEKEEIIELENTLNLFDQKFYSQAILEGSKVIITHLTKLLINNDINVDRTHNFAEVIDKVNKLKLISLVDIEQINEIRKMRNTAAHLNIKHTKEQAEKTIRLIKKLLN